MESAAREIVVADNQLLFCYGVGAMVAAELNQPAIRTCKDFASLMVTVSSLSRPLVIATIDLEGMKGFQGLAELHSRFRDAQILVLLNKYSREQILSALSAGAKGVLSRDSTCAEMNRALRAVEAGGAYIPDQISEDTNLPVREAELHSPLHLTARQEQVLRKLAEGKSNKEIARALGISNSTVKVHLHSLFQAFGVHNRVGALNASQGLYANSDDREQQGTLLFNGDLPSANGGHR